MANNYEKSTVKDTPKGNVKTLPKKKTEKLDAKAIWWKIRDYMIGVYNELKKVHWPDRKALVAYTAVVLFAVALVSGMMFVLDQILGFLLELFLNAFGK